MALHDGNWFKALLRSIHSEIQSPLADDIAIAIFICLVSKEKHLLLTVNNADDIPVLKALVEQIFYIVFGILPASIVAQPDLSTVDFTSQLFLSPKDDTSSITPSVVNTNSNESWDPIARRRAASFTDKRRSTMSSVGRQSFHQTGHQSYGSRVDTEKSSNISQQTPGVPHSGSSTSSHVFRGSFTGAAGVIGGTTSGLHQRTGQTSFSRKLANLVIIEKLSEASPEVQAAILEMMIRRQITDNSTVYNVPKPFVVVAITLVSQTHQQISSHLLDRFFLSYRFEIAQNQPAAPSARSSMSFSRRNPLFRFSVCFCIYHHFTWENTDNPFNCLKLLDELSKRAEQIYIHHDVQRYMRDIITAVRAHPLVHSGASPRFTTDLEIAVKTLSLLYQRSYVTPDTVTILLEKVLSHRILLKHQTPFMSKLPVATRYSSFANSRSSLQLDMGVANGYSWLMRSHSNIEDEDIGASGDFDSRKNKGKEKELDNAEVELKYNDGIGRRKIVTVANVIADVLNKVVQPV
ncbi:hypothetical protein BKA69DRAFT_1037171 [Paraphysoderma sedebokerense]|nr:hypothetical protein BKA69DRAFT_1037171 [Paraphysoderma sedebokerense]